MDSEDRERARQEITSQISTTISEVQEKPLHDDENIFFRIDLANNLSHPRTRGALESLSSTIIAFLDDKQTRLLVEARPEELSSTRINAALKHAIRLIRPLRPKDQLIIDDDNDTKKEFVIHVIPNIAEEKKHEYMNSIIQYLRRKSSLSEIDSLNKEGVILVDARLSQIEKLLEDSNFIFSVEEAPRGSIERSKKESSRKKRTKKKSPHTSIQMSLSSVTNTMNTDDLPIVVVMDSGLNDIQSLRPFIVARDHDPSLFGSPDDDSIDQDGNPISHGTPISYLVTYGENGVIPRAKIISYKVWSSTNQTSTHVGVLDALEKYRPMTRLFVSSVNFVDPRRRKIYYDIDKKAQELGAVVVYSAGNIHDSDFQTIISNGKAYPDYLKDYPVLHPARGVSVTAVGSIVKNGSDKFLVGYTSPFSRCGRGNADSLHKCVKPEVVEHGGNMNSHYQTFNPGVRSVDRHGTPAQFFGTSFASPLFIGKLAEIEGKYGNRITNPETLKAVAFLSCIKNEHLCNGYGEAQRFVGCNRNNAIWIFEGNLKLPENLEVQRGVKKYRRVYWNDLTVAVPHSVRKIVMCIVHSDNYTKLHYPSLHTYLRVTAMKRENHAPQDADDPSVSKEKSHVKFYSWTYKTHRMGGSWQFSVKAEPTVYMMPEDKKDVTVRYGCAILLQADQGHIDSTLTQSCRDIMQQYL